MAEVLYPDHVVPLHVGEWAISTFYENRSSVDVIRGTGYIVSKYF